MSIDIEEVRSGIRRQLSTLKDSFEDAPTENVRRATLSCINMCNLHLIDISKKSSELKKSLQEAEEAMINLMDYYSYEIHKPNNDK